VGNAPYTVRIVDQNGDPATDVYGVDLGGGVLTGTGNPGDDGGDFGVKCFLLEQGTRNQWATIRVVPPTAAP
jgi:immune inhibitor A